MGVEPTLTQAKPTGSALTICAIETVTQGKKQSKCIVITILGTNPTANTDDIIRKTKSSFA